MRGVRGLTIAVAGALSLGAAPLDGQHRPRDRFDRRPEDRAPAGWVGLHFLAADPVGDFGLLVDNGFGGAIEGILPVAADGALSLRLDGGFLIYGHERLSYCFPLPVGCRIDLDLNTNNNIFFAGIGPEIAVPGALSPYVNGTVGFSYFNTTSSLSGTWDYDAFATTEHFSDFVWSGRVGAGLRVRVKGGRKPVLLDVGAQYHRNGVAEYLVKGDVQDNPDGTLTLFPNRTEANLVTFQLGVKIGIPRGDDDDRYHRPRRGRR